MKDELEKIVELHKVMKNAFFFNVNIDNRALYEKAHSRTTTFVYDNHTYMIEQKTEIAECIRYRITYYCDGEQVKKDIRFIKRILKELG